MVMDKSPSPQSVGREFVRQYYTLLNQAPLHLHRFYSSNSSFVHGGLDSINEGGRDGSGGGKVNTDPVHGQHEIHQRIMQLNFRDCKAKIRQVDAHATLGSGVVVQVSGELSNQGQPMRRFMQTFVLAPQGSKKYYVHNDIFRYQDEVFSEGTTELTSGVRSGDRGQEVVDERGQLLESPSPNVMAENEKNAAGVPPLTDSTGHGINSINNNNSGVVIQEAKSVHGQPSNISVGGDGITTVSINPTMNNPAAGQQLGENAATKIKGNNEVAMPTYLNGGSHHGESGMAGHGMTSPPISPQQNQSMTADSPSLATGLSPTGVAQTRGAAVMGPPGAAHGHLAGTGPPPGHPAQGQGLRSPQGPSVKTDATLPDSAAVSPLSSESLGDGAGSPSNAVKRTLSGAQPVAAANTTEESGEEKQTASSGAADSSSAAAANDEPAPPKGPMSFAAMAARNAPSAKPSGPAVPGVNSAGLPPAGFNKSPSGNQGPFGASGAAAQGAAPPGMPMGSGQRAPQAGEVSKEGTPISTTSGAGQGNFAGTPSGGKGSFGSRSGGRGSSGRPSMGGSGGGGRDRFNSTNRDDGQSEAGERRRNNTTAMYPDSQQLFVGNLPHNCTESDLESLFSQFGKVAEIRINSKGIAQSKIMPSGQRVPNFGFVVFETDAAVQACLNKTPVHLPDGHRLNVETKKNNKQMRTEGGAGGGSGGSYQGSGGQSSGGGNNSFGGGSGGQGGSKEGRRSGGGNITGSGAEGSGGMGSSGNRGSQESLPRDGGGGGRGSWGRGSRGSSRGGRGGGGGGGSGSQVSGGMYSGGGGRGSTGSQGGQTSSQSGAGGSMARSSYAGQSAGGASRRS